MSAVFEAEKLFFQPNDIRAQAYVQLFSKNINVISHHIACSKLKHTHTHNLFGIGQMRGKNKFEIRLHSRMVIL